MIEHHPEHFINLLQPEVAYEIISTKLDKELIVRRRETDFVAKIRVGRRIYLFHFEFISQYRKPLVRKAHNYAGALGLKYNCDVVTVLFILKPPSRKPKHLGYYAVSPFGKPMNVYNLAVVHLWELRDEILAGKKEYQGLIPLLPEISEKVNTALLQKQRELLANVKDLALRAELWFYTAAFAQQYFSQKIVSKYFLEDQKMIEHWEEVPIFGDRIKQRFQEGKKEGMIISLRENIMDAVTLRFGEVNGDIERQVNHIADPNKLRNLFRLIIKANSLDEFKKALKS